MRPVTPAIVVPVDNQKRFSNGDGYACELHGSLEALRASLMPPATAYVPPQGQLWEPCPLCGTEPVLIPLQLCEKCYPVLSVGR